MKLGKKLNKRFDPFIEAEKNPSVTSNILLELNKVILRSQPFLQAIHEGFKTIEPILKNYVEKINQSFKLFAPIIIEMVRAHKELPQRIRDASAIFAKNGWYFDPEANTFEDLWDISKKFEDGNIDDGDSTIIKDLTDRLDNIEKNIVAKYQDRAKVLHSAFAAHRNGEYDLAIPIFLIQADGICFELTGESLYGTKNDIPKTASYVEKVDDFDTLGVFLFPLTIETPIILSKKRRKNYKHKYLNRHQVIHGEISDYGTIKNSFQAISILNYVAGIPKYRNKNAA